MLYSGHRHVHGSQNQAVNERLLILSALAERNCYRSYLEIGLGRKGNRIFELMRVESKTSVDPYEKDATHVMGSDEFFSGPGDLLSWDLIFVDGLHHANQVHRDIDNSLQRLNKGGTIVVHDCNPTLKSLQVVPGPKGYVPWSGDVWKAWAWYRIYRSDLTMKVIDIDAGCGIIQRGSQKCFPKEKIGPVEQVGWLPYSFLKKHRKELLNLVPWRK